MIIKKIHKELISGVSVIEMLPWEPLKKLMSGGWGLICCHSNEPFLILSMDFQK